MFCFIILNTAFGPACFSRTSFSRTNSTKERGHRKEISKQSQKMSCQVLISPDTTKLYIVKTSTVTIKSLDGTSDDLILNFKPMAATHTVLLASDIIVKHEDNKCQILDLQKGVVIKELDVGENVKTVGGGGKWWGVLYWDGQTASLQVRGEE